MTRKILTLATSSFAFLISFIGLAYGQETAEAVVSTAPAWFDPSILQYLALGGGLGLGIAAVGSGLGQGKAVASAMDGISRNPQAAGAMFVPMLLGLAFMEALVIFNLIFAFVFFAAVNGAF